MKGRCEECGKRGELAKIDTANGYRYACRSCRKCANREYPVGMQLDKLLTGQRPATRKAKRRRLTPRTRQLLRELAAPSPTIEVKVHGRWSLGCFSIDEVPQTYETGGRHAEGD